MSNVKSTSHEISLYGLRVGTAAARKLARQSRCITLTIEREESGTVKAVTMSGHSDGLTCSRCRDKAEARIRSLAEV